MFTRKLSQTRKEYLITLANKVWTGAAEWWEIDKNDVTYDNVMSYLNIDSHPTISHERLAAMVISLKMNNTNYDDLLENYPRD